jgi:hypothetical protein
MSLQYGGDDDDDDDNNDILVMTVKTIRKRFSN